MKSVKLTLLALSILFWTGCSEDNVVPTTNVELSLDLQQDDINISLEEIPVTFNNINTGRNYESTSDANGKVNITLQEGVYNIIANGEKIVNIENNEVTLIFSGLIENQSIAGELAELDIDMYYNAPSEGWVFKEIFYAGCRTPEGKSYYKDQFIEIYNNSSEVLYADGLSICETQHNTASNNPNEWMEYINNGVVVRTIYTIPGSGEEYPVQPGESLIISSQPIDHRTENANSIDLSGSDWQWYDEGTTDIDVPEVPNLIKNYSYSATFWLLHTGGHNSYVLFRAEDMDSFMETQYVQTENVAGKTIEGYLVPNEIILDAVETSRKDKFQSKALSSTLDLTHTYCDDTFSGVSVRRKVQRYVDDRAILMDTNNSDVDFIKNAALKPGEVE